MSEDKEVIFDYQDIDDVIHARIRLAIMTILLTLGPADFTRLKKQTKTSDGNLSSHLRKLEEAGYIEVDKSFVGRKPLTSYCLSEKGKKAYANYIEVIERLVKVPN